MCAVLLGATWEQGGLVWSFCLVSVLAPGLWMRRAALVLFRGVECLVEQKLRVCYGAVWRKAVEGEWRGCPGLRAAGFFPSREIGAGCEGREGRGSSAYHWNRALHKKCQLLSLLAFASLIFPRPFNNSLDCITFSNGIWVWIPTWLTQYLYLDPISLWWFDLTCLKFIFNLTLGNLKVSRAKWLRRINDVLWPLKMSWLLCL